METFKCIIGLEDYAISNLGNVINVLSGRTIIPKKNKFGYKTVIIHSKVYELHKLVAE